MTAPYPDRVMAAVLASTDRAIPRPRTPKENRMTISDAETYDPAIYSNVSRMVYREDGTSAFERATWRELAEELREDVRNLRRFQTMVLDLDRNENGRHEGDADVGDPSGVSQGNPRLRTGDVLGYSLGGHPYVMPERGKRHDATAWGAR